MNDEARHVIAHVARPSYPALELDCLANFQNKRHTLSRTLARVRLPTPRTQLSGHVARGRDGPHSRRTSMSLWFFYQIPFVSQPSPAKATTQHNRATLHDTLFVEHYTKISQFCVQFREFAFFPESAPSSVERADLSSTPYCRRAAKSHAGIFQRPYPVSDATQRHALGRPQRQDKRDIKFRIAGMADNLIQYSRKRRCGKRRCAKWPFV